MTVDTGRLTGRAGLPAAGRRRRGAGGDLPEPGGRLHDLPADVPVPHRRPAARGVLRRRRARDAGAQGARRPVLAARRRPHARGGPRDARADLGEVRRGRTRRSAPCSTTPRPLTSPASWSGCGPRARFSTDTSRSRTLAASSPPSASCTSRRCSTPSSCCAASSTGSTSRPTGRLRVVDYKGLAVDTPLPTPDGWTTMGEVEVGDRLIGFDGTSDHDHGEVGGPPPTVLSHHACATAAQSSATTCTSGRS